MKRGAVTAPSPAELNWQESTCPDCGLIWSPQQLYDAIMAGSNIMELVEHWRTNPENRASTVTDVAHATQAVLGDLPEPVTVESIEGEVPPNLMAEIFLANTASIERYIDQYGPEAYVSFLVNAGMAAAAEYDLTPTELEQSGVGTITVE